MSKMSPKNYFLFLPKEELLDFMLKKSKPMNQTSLLFKPKDSQSQSKAILWMTTRDLDRPFYSPVLDPKEGTKLPLDSSFHVVFSSVEYWKRKVVTNPFTLISQQFEWDPHPFLTEHKLLKASQNQQLAQEDNDEEEDEEGEEEEEEEEGEGEEGEKERKEEEEIDEVEVKRRNLREKRKERHYQIKYKRNLIYSSKRLLFFDSNKEDFDISLDALSKRWTGPTRTLFMDQILVHRRTKSPETDPNSSSMQEDDREEEEEGGEGEEEGEEGLSSSRARRGMHETDQSFDPDLLKLQQKSYYKSFFYKPKSKKVFFQNVATQSDHNDRDPDDVSSLPPSFDPPSSKGKQVLRF